MRRTCRTANVAFVATSRVGVGPGVKIDCHRFSKNSAMRKGEAQLAVGGWMMSSVVVGL